MRGASISVGGPAPRLRTFGRRNLGDIPGIDRLDADVREAVEVVSAVLPFRTNDYVCRELIDWSAVPEDPMFQLTFPQRGMLDPDDYETVAALVREDAPAGQLDEAVARIRRRLNPHPSGQVQNNVPHLDGRPVPGLQHKYAETVLFFPAQGQTCHSYCSYCFRWAQFVPLDDLKFASKDVDTLVAYLRRHPEVTDVILTGGDPMVMRTEIIERYLDALLAPDLGHVDIRIGTKALAFWPHRFLTDPDADDLMGLFERVVGAGRHLALMAHWSHPAELATDTARRAVARVRSTGAEVRAQAPLVRHVNDDSDTWRDLIRAEVRVGAIPYYLFVERDTGARRYFEVPLERALEVYNGAYRRVSGLGRTIRGPVMSATPGKVLVEDVLDLAGERVFALRFLQARDPAWVNRLFFAHHDPEVAWFDELKPAFGEPRFFFED